MKIKGISKYIIFIIIKGILFQYPEYYNIFEQATFINKENEEEIFLASYYFSASTDPIIDYRNGIKITSLYSSSSVEGEGSCFLSSSSYSESEEMDFNIFDDYTIPFYPPSYNLVPFCIIANSIDLNLISYIDSKDIAEKYSL